MFAAGGSGESDAVLAQVVAGQETQVGGAGVVFPANAVFVVAAFRAEVKALAGHVTL